MQNKIRRVKFAALLAMGGMMLQFGGCLGTLPRNIWTGFGYSLGALPANILAEAYIAPLLEGVIGGGDEEEAAE
jgi:hypothetical protein